MENNDNKENKLVSLTSDEALEYSLTNSKIARYCVLGFSVLCFVASIATGYISKSRNAVAAIPKGDVWEYPMVHWMNMPTRYEDNAKPLHVAQKYVRGLYEVEPLDFSEGNSGTGLKVMLSHRVAELLSYTVPGSPEYLKLSEALQRSEGLYQTYMNCNCIKRFLVSDMMVFQPPIPSLRVQLIGRFVIFGQDGLRPLDVEDLGIKSIVLYLSNDIPLFERSDAQGGRDVKAENPEGWYVISSQISNLSERDLQSLRQIRKETNMKGGL